MGGRGENIRWAPALQKVVTCFWSTSEGASSCFRVFAAFLSEHGGLAIASLLAWSSYMNISANRLIQSLHFFCKQSVSVALNWLNPSKRNESAVSFLALMLLATR